MVVKNVSHNQKLLTNSLNGYLMKKCPVCAVEVEDNAPFCNICGVNLSGAKDVGPSSVETPVSK